MPTKETLHHGELDQSTCEIFEQQILALKNIFRASLPDDAQKEMCELSFMENLIEITSVFLLTDLLKTEDESAERRMNKALTVLARANGKIFGRLLAREKYYPSDEEAKVVFEEGYEVATSLSIGAGLGVWKHISALEKAEKAKTPLADLMTLLEKLTTNGVAH